MPHRALAAKLFAERLRNNGNIDTLQTYISYRPLTPAGEPERKLFPKKTQKLDEDIDYLVKNLSPQDHLALIQPRQAPNLNAGLPSRNVRESGPQRPIRPPKKNPAPTRPQPPKRPIQDATPQRSKPTIFPENRLAIRDLHNYA